jgi:hypothetical protein
MAVASLKPPVHHLRLTGVTLDSELTPYTYPPRLVTTRT